VSGSRTALEQVRVIEVIAEKGAWQPGECGRISVVIQNLGTSSATMTLRVTLEDQGEERATSERTLGLEPGTQTVEMLLTAPSVDARGYHLRAALMPRPKADAGPTDSATMGDDDESPPQALDAVGALLVISHWSLAPRYGFLSEFAPAQDRLDAIADLTRFHLTALQFYDWMYRHYEYLPPEDLFTDAMGRTLSLETVRRRIEACKEHGIAPIAYGAVYGAEREYADDHDGEVLRDAAGERHALAERFFITDPRPGPWRERLLAEYERAVMELGFVGIHMDQYGSPKRAFDADGGAVDLAPALRDLIDAADGKARAADPQARVLFNAVNDWPIDAVATSRQAAVYIEVWAPHDRFRDLASLATRARDLSGKQVVLAAYLNSFTEGGPRAEASGRLATAVINSSGAHHLLLGEGNGVLRDPYYPNHGHLSSEGVARMRRYYDHSAALHHYLFDPKLVDLSRTYATGANAELELDGAPVSAVPEAGAVWLHVTAAEPGTWILNLVNLLGLESEAWNAPHDDPPVVDGLTLTLLPFLRRARATWSTPDRAGGPTVLTVTSDGQGRSSFALPPLYTWATLVIREA